MIAESLGGLPILALVNAFGFGTLVIPVWLLLACKGLRVGRVMVYLGILGGAYFAIGLALTSGLGGVFATDENLLETDAFRYALIALYVQLAVGILLLVIGPIFNLAKADQRVAKRGRRLVGLRARVMGEGSTNGSITALLGVSFIAVLTGAGSILPYLVGLEVIISHGSGPRNGLLILGYCIIVILPALALIIGRAIARPALDGSLAMLDNWFLKNQKVGTAWATGIIGFILAVQAAGSLWLLVPA